MIDLDAIKARLAAATPGPWTIDDGDDGDFCSAIAVIAPIPVSERQHAKFVGDFNERAVIALTLWQNPPVAVIYDARWDENASLIAHAPTDIAALIAEVEALRSEALTMRQWAEEAAAAENANAQELPEARAEVARLRALLGLE